MAILTASGRAALAAAIKQQTLHLAVGLGDPLWDTHKEVMTPFAADGVINLGIAPVSEVVVTSLDGNTVYLLDGDYTVDARAGLIQRLPSGRIPESGEVIVRFKIEHPPESLEQTALLREVGRRVVDEVHFVASDAEGEIVVPTGRYRLSDLPTNHLFIRVRFDFDDVATRTLREQALFVGTVTDATLPPGQKLFSPSEISAPGTLLVLQHSVPIVRQPSTRETFEFVVTF